MHQTSKVCLDVMYLYNLCKKLLIIPTFICIFMTFTGSDGREYPSRCHLERSACEKRMENLEVISNGLCNPCQEKKCDAPRECHVILSTELNNTRLPKCMCNNDCPRSRLEGDIGYVCASNGKTVSFRIINLN